MWPPASKSLLEKKILTKLKTLSRMPKIELKTSLPDKKGYFGPFGGRFVPETLYQPLAEMEREFERVIKDPKFLKEFKFYLTSYAGRPTPLFEATRLSEKIKGPRI